MTQPDARSTYMTRFGLVRCSLFAVVVIACLSASLPAQAAAGDLDPTFGKNGVVITDLGTHTDLGEGVAIQADGKIVAVGRTDPDLNQMFVMRYDASGTLDPSFGEGGVAMGPVQCGGESILEGADGKILVGATCGVLRFLPDGSVDPTFQLAGSDLILPGAIAIQPGGEIIQIGITGPVAPGPFGVERYRSDGSVDRRFGTDGVAEADFGTSGQQPFAVAVDRLGRIVEAGVACVAMCGSPTEQDGFALARFDRNGVVDPSFGTDGRVITTVGPGRAVAYAIALGPKGRIVVTGQAVDPATGHYDFGLARYRASGQLDTSFGVDGTTVTTFGENLEAWAFSVVIQPDREAIAAGVVWSYATANARLALARYGPHGTLDPAFGAGGLVTTRVGGAGGSYSILKAAALQPDAKLVGVGWTERFAGGARTDVLAVRYETS
jgi:uncharacterized delta-60 repeat protein